MMKDITKDIRKMNFWLIDDSEVDNFISAKTINELGISSDDIEVFENSQKALDEIFLRNENKVSMPDVILLDINMPVLDGFEFIDEIDDFFLKEFKPLMFILSNSPLRSDLENFEKQRVATSFIQKPISKEKLEAAIDKQLAKA